MIQLEQVINNRYRIVQRIGQGGFGETFEVDDKGKPKVIKILNTFTDPEKQQKALSLFQREAEVLMKLNHHGIPKVEADGYFTWGDGINNHYCLLMEKIDGHSLDKWLQQNRDKITEELAINLLKQLLLILEYVHQKGYIHRDIKPSNIMVKANDQLVLIDFGSVKEITSTYIVSLVEDIPVTKLMTDGYAPIEQIQGKPAQPSDFFALGRTFVYLLTGKEPKKFTEDDSGKLIWREQMPNVSDSLGDLIDWMMEVFPRDRPQNCKEIWQELKNLETNYLENKKPSSLRKCLIPEKPNKILNFIEKLALKKSLIIKIITNLLFLAIIVFLSKIYIVPRVADELFFQGSNRFQAKELEKAESLYRLALFLEPNYPEIYFSIGKVYEKRAENLQIQERKANLYFAETQYRKAIALKPTYDKPYNNLGRLLILKGQSDAAIPLLKKGLDLTKDKDVEYTLLKNLGWALKEQKQYEAAKVYLQLALASNGKLAPAYCLLATILDEESDKAGAQDKWQNCLKYASEEKYDDRIWKNHAQKRLQSQKTEK